MPETPANTRSVRRKLSERVYPNDSPQAREISDRFIKPPADAVPVDKGIHLRWVRTNKRRLSDMARMHGYENANEADVMPGHGGYVEDGQIVKGDLVLMKTDRDYVEEKELKRISDLDNMDKRVDVFDRQQGVEQKSGHHVRSERRTRPQPESRAYNIPIEFTPPAPLQAAQPAPEPAPMPYQLPVNPAQPIVLNDLAPGHSAADRVATPKKRRSRSKK